MIEYTIIQNKNHKLELVKTSEFYVSKNEKNKTAIIGDIMNALNREKYISQLDNENAYVVAFDNKGISIGLYNVCIGNQKYCTFYVKNVITFLLLIGARQFIIIHNHPDNMGYASDEDYSLKEDIFNISNLFDIYFLGSYIAFRDGWVEIGEENYYKWEK